MLMESLKELRNVSSKTTQERSKELVSLVVGCRVEDAEQIVLDVIVDNFTVCKSIESMAKERNLISIRLMTIGIKDWTCSFFHRDGYGNYENIDDETLNCLIDDVVSCLEQKDEE